MARVETHVRSHTLRVVVLLHALAGCGSDGDAKASSLQACDDSAHKVCTCDDGSKSTYVCSDDALICQCDESSSDTETKDAAPRTTSHDAGRTTATVDAANPDAQVPTADDAQTPSDASTPPAPSSGDAPDPAMLPKSSGSCPEFKEGMMTFKGSQVQVYVGDDGESKLGPLVFYWYATFSSIAEVNTGLSPDIVKQIKAQGGMVAAMVKSTGMGDDTGDAVWFTGDYAIADEILACAIEKKVGVDTSRIHAIGFSAGGLQSSWMAYARNNYMASVVAYSGGLTGIGSIWITPTSMTPDPSNVVSAMLFHGDPGVDVVVEDFAAGSAAMEADIKMKSGFSLDCNHGGGHLIPKDGPASAWQFMQDHPYKTKPSPYVASGIPASFPKYCKIP